MEFDFEHWAELPSLAEADAKTLAETARDILDAKKATKEKIGLLMTGENTDEKEAADR